MKTSVSIVRPRAFKNFPADRVLFVPMDVPSGLIQKRLREQSDKEKKTDWGILYGLGKTAVLFRAVGAPLAVLSLERFVASGAREILILGFCGSLNPDYRLSSPVSIVKAYANEGTSGHYCPGRKIFHASRDLQRVVEARLNERGLACRRGSAVTTDAPYRETPGWIRNMRRRGMDVVDMETSAVFGLARFHKLRAAALLIVSDELFSGRWKNAFSSPGLAKSVRDYFFPFLEKRSAG